MKRPAVLAVAVLVGVGLVPALPGPSAAAADAPARTITVSDPRGDVIDADDTTTTRARKIDVTGATYSVRRDRGFQGGRKKTETVHFEVDYSGYLRSKRNFGCREQLVVTFTSGDREYRASTGESGIQSRTAGGSYEDVGTSYGTGCGGSTTEATSDIDIPARVFEAGTITDIRATLRVGRTRARDVVETSTSVLRFDPRR